MNTITLDVSEIDVADRQALEHVLGSALTDDQQVVIAVRPKNFMTAAERLAFEEELASWDAAADEDFQAFADELEK